MSKTGTAMKRFWTTCLLVLIVASCSQVSAKKRCSGKWLVTGYFTPVEKDYDGTVKKTIKVTRVGKFTFSKKFLKVIKMEGWGKTRAGWYLGFYSGKWHKSKTSLAANGNPLKIGIIATDNKLIARGKKIKIPALPGRFKDIVYISSDVGQQIRGKHIDVYMGEGKQAEKATLKITGKNYRICRISK